MIDNSPGPAKRLFFLALAVLFAAWVLYVVVSLLSAIWWQLLVIAAVICAVIVVIFTLRNRWR
ncbi:hypothetical protein ABCS02_14085 [Microbacterium sp. X-17]|uniref:hypothetical protein n=1 Tax=Microbacterium sp. X-17 TaxID=3144404 RepID=UPI0031F4FAB1